LKADFFAVEIEDRPDCNEIQSVLGNMTGAKTVPRVFVNGNFIGGGSDVKKLNEEGKLAEMLK
jgi:glutaredoxin 3